MKRNPILLLVGLLFAFVLCLKLVYIIPTEYSKHTYLKEFYKNSELITAELEKLTFENFVLEENIEGFKNKGGRGPKSFVKYCSPPGLYVNDSTGIKKRNARTCSKGITRYYWLPRLDAQTIITSKQAMIDLNWKDRSKDSQEQSWIIEYLTKHEQSGRGFNFKKENGLYSTITFLNRNGSENGNASSKWCTSCSRLDKADLSHQYYLEVSIYVYHGFED